jgi:hypothetical protein
MACATMLVLGFIAAVLAAQRQRASADRQRRHTRDHRATRT